MVELENIPQTAREQIQTMGAADVVVAVAAASGPADLERVLASVRDALAMLSTQAQGVILHSVPQFEPAAPDQSGAVRVLSCPLFKPEPAEDPLQSLSAARQAAFAVSEKLGARACAWIASDAGGVTPRWIHGLIQPVLDLNYDLVTPCYDHHKFEGLINSSIIAPLTRALYGKRIQYPMGPDFGFSARCLERLLASASANRRMRALVTMTGEVICAGLKIGQSHVGVRVNPPTDWTNLSSLLAQILGPLFLDMEQKAPYWQRVRGSEPVPEFGDRTPMGEETGAVDVQHMIESFQLGYRSLLDVWGIVLPPATLFELGKLARLPPDRFRMPDDLWARIIYDFALGHHLGAISPDHLLRAMTPLYLAWVASYGLEANAAGPETAEQRIERLSQAYEVSKPYLLSRWRWPDGFNP
jgi:hypothetical protein